MAEKRTVELEIKDNSKSLKAQLKEAVMEVQKLSDAYGATSAQAIEAAKRAGILKDKIADSADLVKSFNPDAKFNALSKSLGGVLDGFQAFEGALGLVGVEGEAVQKTLLKVQSAMALSQGLQGLGEARDSFKQLGGVISDSYQSLLRLIVGQQAEAVVATEVAVATGAEAVATEGAAVAQLSLNAAMRANPIGAILTGVVLLTAAIGGLVFAMSGQSSEQKKQSELAKRNAEDRKESAKYVAKESAGFVTLISQLKQSNAGSKEREELITKINKNYGTTLKNLQNEANFQSSLNAELASYIEYQKAKYKLQKNESLITGNLEKQDTIQVKISKTQKELNKLIKEGAYEKKSMYETDDLGHRTFIGYIQDTDKVLAANKLKETLEAQKKSLSDTKERLDRYAESSINAESKINDLTNGGKKYNEVIDNTSTSTNTNTKSNQDLIQSLKDLQDANEEVGKNEVELLDLKKQRDLEALQLTFDNSLKDKQATQALADAKLLIDKKYDEDRNAIKRKSVEDLENIEVKTVETVKSTSEQKIDIVKATTAEEIAIAKEKEEKLKELKFKGVKDGLQAIATISELFAGKSKAQQMKAFKIQKAANIAIATMDTYKSATSAFSSLSGIPIVGPILGGLAAAGAVAAGIINIKKIKASTFEGGGDTGGGGGGGGGNTGGGGGSVAAVTPTFNVVGNNGMNQLAQLQQQPVQAFVVSGEVTSAQALDRNRMKNATL